MRHHHSAAVLAALCLASLTACTPTAHAEYARYDSLDAMNRRADAVVEVTIEGSRRERLMSSFSGTNPETNPYAGVPASESPPADESAVDVVVATARAIDSITGSAEEGDVIDIAQNANEEDLVYLNTGDDYLLFLLTAGDGPAGIVGGDQGQYRIEGGDLVPADAESAIPLTTDDVAALREGAAVAPATAE